MRPFEGRLSPTSRIVALVLAGWALLVVVPDFARLFLPMGSIGLTSNNNGTITVYGSPASDADIVSGDHLDLGLLNCFRHWKNCHNTMAVFGGMGGIQYVLRPNDDVTLPVIRNSRLRQHPSSHAALVTLRAGPAEMTFWDRFWLAADEAGALIFITLAFVLLWRRPGVTTWGFFLYAIWFNPGQYFYLYALLQRWPAVELCQEVAQTIAQAFGYAGFLQFALRFPSNEPGVFWQPLRRWILPLIVGFLSLLQLASFASAFGIKTERITDIAYIAGMLVDAFVIVALWRRSKKQSPIDRQRTRWVTMGCVVGLAAFVFADSNVATSLWTPLWNQTYFGHDFWSWVWQEQGGPSESVTGFFFLGNMLLVIAVFHAIRRHRVIDVNFVVSRAIVLLSIGITWVVLGAVLERAIDVKVFEQLPYTAVVIGLGGFTMTVDKARELLNDLADRVFFRRLHEAEKRLALIGEAMLEADSFEAIERLFVAEPLAALDLASGAVFRRIDGVFRRTISVGWEESSSSQLPADCTLVPELRASQAPLRTPPLTWSALTVPQGTGLPVLAIPVAARANELFAIVAYGAHNTGDDLNVDERKILFDMAKKAALAYEHIETKLLQSEIEELKKQIATTTQASPPMTPAQGRPVDKLA